MKASFRYVRSVFESPILDDHKWNKLPDIPADLVFIDLEDSVPAHRKEEARTKALACLEDPTFLDGRMLLPRPNHLSSEWGHADVAALAATHPSVVAYPKIRSAEDVHELVRVWSDHGPVPEIIALIETPAAILNLREISEVEEVAGLMWGPADLCADASMPLFQADGSLNESAQVARALTALAAAGRGIAAFDVPFTSDLRDLKEIRRLAKSAKDRGYTGMATFYPPHVEILNEVFDVTDEELTEAREVIELYEAALAKGDPAVLTAEGKAILTHDYQRAQARVEQWKVHNSEAVS